jgi:hypothetical protein
MSRRTPVTARLARAVISVGVTAAIFAFGLTGASAATARASASNGGGYLAKPAHLRSARMAMRVPMLQCAKSGPSSTVTIGLFGSMRSGSDTSPWTVAIVASCIGGVSKYRAALGDTAGPNAMRVHHGDLVRLSVQDGPQWQITDVTTHRGVGATAASGPTGPPKLDRHVLIGAHLGGRLSRAADVTIRGVKINRQPLGQAPLHRRVQSRGMAIVVRPGGISTSGTRFPISVG